MNSKTKIWPPPDPATAKSFRFIIDVEVEVAIPGFDFLASLHSHFCQSTKPLLARLSQFGFVRTMK